MEELLLGLLFAGDELHVVHQQKIRLAVFLPHVCGFALPDGVHQLIGEVVALHIGDSGLGVVFSDHIGNGVNQVGFSKTGVPIDEKGVIVFGWVLGNGEGGGIGKLVGRTHHKGLKGKFSCAEAVVLPVVFSFVGTLSDNANVKIHGENISQDCLDVF